MERLDKIGVELEGGWNEPFPEEDPTEIFADHSVHLQGFRHVGEVASPPLELEEALSWVDTHYPNGSDSTCGMHVHLSVKEDGDYVKLCRTPHFHMKFLLWGKGFLDGISKGSRDWNDFAMRITGGNRFCSMRFIPEKQLLLMKKDQAHGNRINENPRYAMLNFSKNVHGTFENRVFPLFKDKKIALRGISSYVEMVEEFLRDFKEREFSRRVVL